MSANFPKHIRIASTDRYLTPNTSFLRLYDEYKKYGSLFVAYDFDDTVHDYHKTGSSYNDVKHLLRELKSIGCTLICWTAYKDHKYVENFLKENDIPCDGINTDGVKLDYESRKPFYSVLLDDRAGLAQVYQELSLLVELVKREKPNL